MINEKELKRIVQEWAKGVHAPIRIYLFGSQAKGTANAQSDIDLAIEFLETISAEQMNDIVICDGVELERRISERMGKMACLEDYRHRKVKKYVEDGFLVIYESK